MAALLRQRTSSLESAEIRELLEALLATTGWEWADLPGMAVQDWITHWYQKASPSLDRRSLNTLDPDHLLLRPLSTAPPDIRHLYEELTRLRGGSLEPVEHLSVIGFLLQWCDDYLRAQPSPPPARGNPMTAIIEQRRRNGDL